MAKDKDPRRDIWWGEDGIERLDRLCASLGETAAIVARQALLEYELRQGEFREIVRDAVLDFFRALLPDEQYDPADDPREVQALERLGALLGSSYAAQGIAEAFRRVLAHNLVPLQIPSVEQDHAFPGEDSLRTER